MRARHIYVSQKIIARVWDDCTRHPRSTFRARHKRLNIAWISLQSALEILRQHGHIVTYSGGVQVRTPFCLTEVARA